MMEKVYRERIVNVIASLLLAIISIYYTNSTIFIHTHVVDGKVVTHSHFYGEQHLVTEDGGHSSDELLLIDILDDIIAIRSESITISELYTQREYLNYTPSILDPTSERLCVVLSSRAPPYLAA